MKIISWNVNGLRAVHGRGFLAWLRGTGADIVCLQEVKAQEDQLPPELHNPPGYRSYFNSGERKGYSGVACYVREEPLSVGRRFGLERFDAEGRMLELRYPLFTLVNLYVPQGGRAKENLPYKLEFYERLIGFMRRLRHERVAFIGDFNIAHEEIDLARPKENRNSIMFTPEERKQIDAVVELGYADSFRTFHREGGHYTWWPYFAQARQRNLGWRIDYAFTSPSLTPELKDAFIWSDVKGSDHCPVGIELNRPI